MENRVLAEKSTNYNNPQYNHHSSFEYNENGKIVREIQDNQIFKEVVWANDKAKVFNKNNDLIGEFHFDSSMKLISYNSRDTIYLNYDIYGNVISEATNTGIFVEYLDYNTSIVNPLSIINSIAILRID